MAQVKEYLKSGEKKTIPMTPENLEKIRLVQERLNNGL